VLSLFRTNQIIANVLLIFYAAICRFSPFVTGHVAESANAGILADYFYTFTNGHPVLVNILSILIVFIQAILVNILVAQYRMANEMSLFPGLFYILLVSSIPDFLSLSPPLLANTFYIIALLQLFETYKKNTVAAGIFNTGFWLAIGSLFYFSTITFVILAFIGLGTIRTARLKENLVLIIGFIVPYFLCNVIYFWNDQLGLFWQQQFTDNFGFLDLAEVKVDWELYVKLLFFLLLILFAMFNAGSFGFKKNTQVRKYIGILYWGMLIAGLATTIQASVSLQHLLLLTPPLAIFLSFSFQKINKPMAESIHLVLLFAILILQFKPLWMPG